MSWCIATGMRPIFCRFLKALDDHQFPLSYPSVVFMDALVECSVSRKWLLWTRWWSITKEAEGYLIGRFVCCFKTSSIQESSLVVGEDGFIHSVVKFAKHSRVGKLFWDWNFSPFVLSLKLSLTTISFCVGTQKILTLHEEVQLNSHKRAFNSETNCSPGLRSVWIWLWSNM